MCSLLRQNPCGVFSNEAGDLWFEIHRVQQNPSSQRWDMMAGINVPCDRETGRLTRGYSCTHNLLDLDSRAFSPAQAIAVLAEHVETLERDLQHRSPAGFLGLSHEQLPA